MANIQVRNHGHTPIHKNLKENIKYLEMNLIKELKVCYSGDFKLRKKEIKILENGYHAWKSNVHM